MSNKPLDTADVIYHEPRKKYAKLPTSSIDPIGLDTEADTDGRCFMICTSLGDIWKPENIPECFFDRTHRDQTYVVYNLKYDSGALLQHLDRDALQTLRKTDRVTVGEYKYRVIANKLLSISKGHKYVNIYDIMGYYGGSLDYNALKYLGEQKIDIETKDFDYPYITDNWDTIAEYCIKDCTLTKRLADRLIKQLNTWGMHVRKLYSTAHISYAWFSAKCGHPSVGWIWRMERKVLDYAMASYNGGKFEVTEKGSGYFYEYDIASAYPASIRNLVDLDNARIIWSNKYRKSAVYGFLDCTVNIPASLPSPIAVKRGYLNTYPCGTFRKVITKAEYEYLVNNGGDATIHNACWIHVDTKHYLYRDEIDRLYQLKSELKHTDDKLAYHTIKILMNSLYGKFVQLIESNGLWRAGNSWNPIFASYITAETRVRVSALQLQYPEVIAVHTDSIISKSALPFEVTTDLGSLSYETEGDGLIAGCGVYQIGLKTALRGVSSKTPLKELVSGAKRTLDITNKRPYSWRQVLANGWSETEINHFVEIVKQLRPDSDKKRLWLSDAKDWQELLNRSILSVPYVYSPLLYK
jgi:DNA polymerase type B, organellar and viral